VKFGENLGSKQAPSGIQVGIGTTRRALLLLTVTAERAAFCALVEFAVAVGTRDTFGFHFLKVPRHKYEQKGCTLVWQI
jgi:hypothetical protein